MKNLEYFVDLVGEMSTNSLGPKVVLGCIAAGIAASWAREWVEERDNYDPPWLKRIHYGIWIITGSVVSLWILGLVWQQGGTKLLIQWLKVIGGLIVSIPVIALTGFLISHGWNWVGDKVVQSGSRILLAIFMIITMLGLLVFLYFIDG